ncbi:anti-sigma regulatory factor (Ser/Thr protein kinase) [Nocardiopsis arvandica]|uniref:Anti-sigma regulatory factor (Ser/Thr protein kinase) n=1 Tax=Nocardiopsis sinuspersici TaxID=501010 RepID=A0A7Y9XA22_9ACTN|nr:ATP-binding protein [Nocardiopsis sinuspersici]NYH52001.1 anti-sigma regulatory factor (Ser/Thr protein kinase) [Nocardiopsis sinuspersici]
MSGPVRWEHRVYSGNLRELAQVRSDLAADLAGFDPDLVAALQLCLSELFANAVKYTDSGTEHGEVVRTLSLPGPAALRLSVSDSGGGGGLPRIPVERDGDEWDWAEGQRGLLLVQNLSRAWGHHPLVPWGDLGTNVWAEFAVDPATVPQGLRPYVFTH